MPCSPVIAPFTDSTQLKQIIQHRFSALFRARLCQIHHDIHMDVAVARMAETGEWQTMFLLQCGGKFKQIFQFSARHDDVLVQLGQAGVAQRVGKFPANLPDGFALFFAKTAFDEQRLFPLNNFFNRGDFVADGIFLSVQLHNQMCLAAEESVDSLFFLRRRPA